MPFPHRVALHRAVTRHDSRLGQRYVPSAEVRVPHERGCYWVRTNAQGFRADRDFTAAHDAGTPRVLVLGDSYTAGDGVNNGERFTELLAARHGVEVLNLGLSGAGADQLVLALEEVMPALAPTLVVVAVTVHTIERVRASERVSVDHQGRIVRVPRPHFVIAGDSLSLCGVPVPEATAITEPAPRPPSLDTPWRVALADLARRAVGARGRAIGAGSGRLVGGLYRRMVQRVLGVELDPDYSDASSDGWRLLARILVRLHEVAGAVPVVVAPLPTPIYVGDRLVPRYTERFASLDAPERGLHVIDVTRALRAAPSRVRRGYTYSRDRHPTPLGHRALAEAISDALVERALLAPAPRATPPPRPRRRVERDAVLRVGFTDADAFVCVVTGGTATGLVWESRCAREYTCLGSLPYAAIASALEHMRIEGPELSRVELCAPEHWEAVLMRAVAAREATPLLAAYVRWEGAAAVDLRRFIGSAVTTCAVVGESPAELTPTTPAERDDGDKQVDAEGLWLQREVERVITRGGSRAALRLSFLRLCTRWERATRRVRHATLP